MERYTYHVRVDYWIIFGGFGLASIWGGLQYFALSYESTYGLTHILEHIMGILLFGSIFLFGLLLIAILLTSKITISSDGIEYSCISGVIKSRWTDMKGRIYHNGIEYMINLHSTNPEIKLRPWTRYVPWDANKLMFKNGFPVSEFGGRNPKQFIERIGLFAPHLGL